MACSEETYSNWIAELDMRGPSVSIDFLRDHLVGAPGEIKEHGDYIYYQGFYDGRIWFEGGEGTAADRLAQGYLPFVPLIGDMTRLAQMEDYLASACQETLPEASPEYALFNYVQGLLDGCILHAELGGV